MKITSDHIVYSLCAVLLLAGLAFIYLGLTQNMHATTAFATGSTNSASRQMGYMMRSIAR